MAEQPSPQNNEPKFKLDKEYTLAELLEKKKEDLDKLKLASELVSQKKRTALDWVRAIMIPVLIAFLSWLSTSIITKSNQAETALNNDKKYVRDIDMEIRKTTDVSMHRLWVQRLQVFRSNNVNCTDVEILSIIEGYKTLLRDEYERRQKDSISVMAQKELTPSDTALLAQVEKQEVKFQNAKILYEETKDPSLKDTMNKLKAEYDNLVSTSPKLKNTFDKTDSLGIKTQAQIRAVEPVAAENVEATPIYWFKEGNFLICFDELKVLLHSIDPVSKTIKFSAYRFDKSNPQSNENIIEKDLTVSLGSTIKLGEKYTLKLVSIDHAGRNPFTMAAYVTCTKIDPLAVVKKVP
jgi:hypothetical protein